MLLNQLIIELWKVSVLVASICILSALRFKCRCSLAYKLLKLFIETLMKEINIFKDNDIKAKLNAWDISLNKEQMKTLQYCHTFSNNFDLIKDIFKSSKMFMNVVITLLLISIDQKVKVLNSFNRAADAFIIKLHKQFEAFCQKKLDITN